METGSQPEPTSPAADEHCQDDEVAELIDPMNVVRGNLALDSVWASIDQALHPEYHPEKAPDAPE